MVKVNVVRPHDVDPAKGIKIFLAGTIDMGSSEDWQSKFIDSFKDFTTLFKADEEFTLYNPRRVQGFDNDEVEYEYQVNWELDRLEQADAIIMYILGTSKSPITLMELGNFKNKNIYVICEENFYRYKYVEMFCSRYKIPLFKSMKEFSYIIDKIKDIALTCKTEEEAMEAFSKLNDEFENRLIKI